MSDQSNCDVSLIMKFGANSRLVKNVIRKWCWKKMIGSPDEQIHKMSTKETREEISFYRLNWKSRQEGTKRGGCPPFKNPSNYLVIIEGNIGVGKTTLAEELSRTMGYKLFVEPASENPYLENFYSDPHRYALPLQLWILSQRYTTYHKAVNHLLATGGGVILDRSIFSDVVFANVCKREGYISDEGYSMYQLWRRNALCDLPLPHVVVYLDATPQCCHLRIQERGRECEGGVPLDYLEKLHKEYILFLEEMKDFGSHVLNYDWSHFKQDRNIISDILNANVIEWNNQLMKTFLHKSSISPELFHSTFLQELC